MFYYKMVSNNHTQYNVTLHTLVYCTPYVQQVPLSPKVSRGI